MIAVPLGIPFDAPDGLAQACDYLSASKKGKLILSEVKGVTTGEVNAGKAMDQLNNTMAKLAEGSLAGDVEVAEIIIPKGAPLKGDFAIVNGYLVKPGEGNRRATLKGFKTFVRVIEL